MPDHLPEKQVLPIAPRVIVFVLFLSILLNAILVYERLVVRPISWSDGIVRLKVEHISNDDLDALAPFTLAVTDGRRDRIDTTVYALTTADPARPSVRAAILIDRGTGATTPADAVIEYANGNGTISLTSAPREAILGFGALLREVFAFDFDADGGIDAISGFDHTDVARSILMTNDGIVMARAESRDRWTANDGSSWWFDRTWHSSARE